MIKQYGSYFSKSLVIRSNVYHDNYISALYTKITGNSELKLLNECNAEKLTQQICNDENLTLDKYHKSLSADRASNISLVLKLVQTESLLSKCLYTVY